MSDQDNDMFKTPPEGGTPTANTNPENPLDLVKREDGSRKYASEVELAKGYINAEAHIKSLQQKLDELQSGKAKTAVEAALEQVLAERAKGGEPPPASGLSEEAVIALLERVNAQKAAETNVSSIREELVKQAGGADAASKLFKEKAAELGISTSDLTALSGRSPAAVRKLLGLGEKQHAPSKGGSTIIPQGLPRTEPERKRILLGGATTADILSEWNACKPQ